MNPTQVAHPWRASIRTGLQTATAVLAALVLALPLVQEFVAKVAPDSPVIGWIAAATGVVAALATLITRLTALPAVNDLLTRLGIGPVSKDEA